MKNSGARSAIVGGALAIAAFASPAHALTITSFETPYLGAGGYGYNPSSPYQGGDVGAVPQTVDGVTFSGMSGIQGNGSAWNFTPVPNGVQSAFLQSYDGCGNCAAAPGDIAFGETLAGGTSEDLVFYAETRPYAVGGNPLGFTVTINGKKYDLASPPDTSWYLEVLPFTAIAGTNNFEIAINPLPGDHSIGIDAISLDPAPLPSTWTMLIAGFIGIGFLAYRRKRQSGAIVAV